MSSSVGGQEQSGVRAAEDFEDPMRHYSNRMTIFCITMIFNYRWFVLFGWIFAALMSIYPASLVESYTEDGVVKAPAGSPAGVADDIMEKLFPYQGKYPEFRKNPRTQKEMTNEICIEFKTVIFH